MRKMLFSMLLLLFAISIDAQVIEKPRGCFAGTNGTNPNVLASSYGLIAVALGTSPTTHGMLTDGIFYDSSHSFTIGVPLYLNPSTSGTLTVTPPGSNDIARVVGYAIDANNIYFQPDKTWISVD